MKKLTLEISDKAHKLIKLEAANKEMTMVKVILNSLIKTSVITKDSLKPEG